MRPVPVVFLLSALALHWSVKLRSAIVLSLAKSPFMLHTLSDRRSGISAVCAGVLLDVERTAAW